MTGGFDYLFHSTDLESSNRNGGGNSNRRIIDVHCVSKGEDDQWEPDYKDNQNQQQSSHSVLDERAFLLGARGWIILQ